MCTSEVRSSIRQLLHQTVSAYFLPKSTDLDRILIEGLTFFIFLFFLKKQKQTNKTTTARNKKQNKNNRPKTNQNPKQSKAIKKNKQKTTKQSTHTHKNKQTNNNKTK